MSFLYLSRHGETLQNKLDEEYPLPCAEWEERADYFWLTDEGVLQAVRLGRYLRKVTDPASLFFVTSDMERSIQTAVVVAHECGLRLSDENHLLFEDLAECNPVDYGHDVVPPTGMRWQDYARVASDILVEQSYERPHIVAPLHGILNMCLLRWFGGDVDETYLQENCQLHVCRRYGTAFSVEKYVPHKAMRRL